MIPTTFGFLARLDVVLGALCGLAAGAWVSCHSYVSGCFKRWRSTRRGDSVLGARLGGVWGVGVAGDAKSPGIFPEQTPML